MMFEGFTWVAPSALLAAAAAGDGSLLRPIAEGSEA